MHTVSEVKMAKKLIEMAFHSLFEKRNDVRDKGREMTNNAEEEKRIETMRVRKKTHQQTLVG